MAKKDETSAAPAPAPTTDLSAFCGKAKLAESYTEQWIGYSPDTILPGVDPASVEQHDQESLLGHDIVIAGYSLRAGKFGDFAVIASVNPETNKVFTFVTGGTVILRKLKVIGEKNGFPVRGRLTRPSGKRYFDFTA